MRKNRNQKTKKGINLLNFFSKYWVTFALIIALLTLFRQNFMVNKLPASLAKKRQTIDENIRSNQTLEQHNKNLILKLKNAADDETVESHARYRFGLVKPDEIFYQINQ